MENCLSSPAVGIYFLPSEDEKIVFLLCKVAGRPIPRDNRLHLIRTVDSQPCDNFLHHIRTVDIYGDEEPWEIFNDSGKFENYFFTKLKRVNYDGATTFRREVGKGVWQALDRGEKASIFDSSGDVIGFSQRFKYRSETNTDQDGRWMLQEYSLDGGFQFRVKLGDADYRFCFLMKMLEGNVVFDPDRMPALQRAQRVIDQMREECQRRNAASSIDSFPENS